jgi:hypothetical protein
MPVLRIPATRFSRWVVLSFLALAGTVSCGGADETGELESEDFETGATSEELISNGGGVRESGGGMRNIETRSPCRWVWVCQAPPWGTQADCVYVLVYRCTP